MRWLHRTDEAAIGQALIGPVNDLFAPATRAYSQIEVETIELDGRDIGETEATFTLRFKAHRTAWKPGEPLPGIAGRSGA